jgi:cysteine desulfurase
LFTSSASEANNALFYHLSRRLRVDQRVAVSAVEHPSLRAAAVHWLGLERVDFLAVNEQGRIGPGEVAAWLQAQGERAGLVSVMAANNESGTLQPWGEISRLCADAGVAFHTDATQWLGKLPARAHDAEGTALGSCQWLTASGHKLGAPKGVGLLVMPGAEVDFQALIHGGPQEQGKRAGTENLAAVLALVAAMKEASGWCAEAENGRMVAGRRDAFEASLMEQLPGLRVIGAGAARLWNTSLLVMPRHSQLKWVTRLSQAGFSISTGSACSSGKEGASVVVTALGASDEELRRVIRVSGGWQTSAEAWQALAGRMVEIDEALSYGGGHGARKLRL